MPTETFVSTNGIPRTTPSFNRLGPLWFNWLKALVGAPHQRRLARAALWIDSIRYHETEFSRLSDDELRRNCTRLRGRARGREPLDRLLPEAFGLMCVAAHRVLNLRAFDVQLAGAIVMHQGGLAEMATGEGKTLTATFPAFLNALVGKGVHATTVNDYLAKRDAEWTAPLYRSLGLTVGYLQASMGDEERRRAYQCDVTYATAAEFGFDFLRDCLLAGESKVPAASFLHAWGCIPAFVRPRETRVQRDLHFAIVDEADSIFIDESRSPLIISSGHQPATAEEQAVYRWASDLAARMVINEHFTIDEKKDRVELTSEGKRLVRWSVGTLDDSPTRLGSEQVPAANPAESPWVVKNVFVGASTSKVPVVGSIDKLQDQVERALRARHRLHRDQHYLIENNELVIIDEYTGRRMPDRQWKEELHQAVQAKEGLPITKATEHAAQITFQRFFGLYKKLCGLTGTAWPNFLELRRVYKLWVVCVPTNRPVLRQQWPDRVFPTQQAKFAAVVSEVQRLHAQGRPVLLGTRSVQKSEELSDRLTRAGIPHQVLNAKNHEQEAAIVAQAGQRSQVTIATNMAGRGTDIKLGPGVAELGGLHVLGTERHEARRVDCQLAGRAGRQGDPGSCQFFLALDDDLLEALGPAKQEALRKLGQQGGERDWQRFAPLFLRAQRRIERRHRLQRLDVVNRDRQREEVLKDLAANPYVD